MSHQYLPPELPLCNITSLTDFLCNNWVAEKGMYLWSNIFGNWNCKLLINLHQQTSAHQSDIFMWAIIRFSSSTDNLTTTTFEMWLGHLAQWLRCRSHSGFDLSCASNSIFCKFIPERQQLKAQLLGSSDWRFWLSSMLLALAWSIPGCLRHLRNEAMCLEGLPLSASLLFK